MSAGAWVRERGEVGGERGGCVKEEPEGGKGKRARARRARARAGGEGGVARAHTHINTHHWYASLVLQIIRSLASRSPRALEHDLQSVLGRLHTPSLMVV